MVTITESICVTIALLAATIGCSAAPLHGQPLSNPPPVASRLGLVMPPIGRSDDCAPAALWCLAHYQGVDVPFEQVIDAVQAPTGGWTPADLAVAATRIGVLLVVRRVETSDLRAVALGGEPAALFLGLDPDARGRARHVAVLAGADPAPGPFFLLDRDGRLCRWEEADIEKAIAAGGSIALLSPDVDLATRAAGATRLPEGDHTPEEWVWFGRGFAARARWDLAIGAYGRAIDIRPDDLAALDGLAEAQEESGRTEAAARTRERIAALQGVEAR